MNRGTEVLAIDPGDEYSAYVLGVYRGAGVPPLVLKHGKVLNRELLDVLEQGLYQEVCIEMLSCYGKVSGASMFETAVWIGIFYAVARKRTPCVNLVYRREVKLNIAGRNNAKDGDIIAALKERFGDKGTKKNPGYFYGFGADVWQAFALLATVMDGPIDEARLVLRGE